MIEFELEIEPLAQPRIKARRIGNHIQVYTPQNAAIKAYKAAIAEAFKQVAGETFEPLKGPLCLTIGFTFERPQARLKEGAHIIKPDLDNLTKGLLDALNKIAWLDDSQVVELHIKKSWASTKLGGPSGRKLLSDNSNIKVSIESLESNSLTHS